VSRALLAAAALAVLLGVVHSWLGERYILIRLLRRDNLPKLFGGDRFTKSTLRFAWHLTTVAWLGFAALALALAMEEAGRPAFSARQVLAGTALASAVVTLVGSRGRHPAWVVFLAIGVLALA
jgi:hypothetical protein